MADPITLMQMALQLFFALSEQAGKTREERDELYNLATAKYDKLPDPYTLKDTWPQE